MNRDALNEWFAQADDILTDWRPGGDAMHATPPADEGEGRLPARADSYYDQGDRTLLGMTAEQAAVFAAVQMSWSAPQSGGDYPRQQIRLRLSDAEFERLRSTVLLGPDSGWVVEIRDGVGRWRNLTTPEDDTP
jgi:hypothetical protein